VQHPDQRRIGLTGGIATGKSTVATYLADYHQMPVLDADVYARAAVARDSPILRQICDRYGPSICHSDGQLDREQLGNRIFNDPDERCWLESKIHPFVSLKLTQSLEDFKGAPVVVLVIPLLFEAGLTDRVSEIWVVRCSLDRQIERLIQRNSLTREQAMARIAAQWPLAEKCRLADVVLDNEGCLQDLYPQIETALCPSSLAENRR
jgi:dephospho-CoA kinase